MSTTRTLLFNGTDLRSFTGMIVQSINLRAPGTRKGGDKDLPYRQGSLAVPGLKYAAYAFSAFVVIEGTTPEQLETNLAAIGSTLAGTDGLGTLTRRIPVTGGSGYVDHTASGRFVQGFSFQMMNYLTGTTELQFVNLDGAWTPDGGTTWLVP